MSARGLLEKLREREVHLKADGMMLRVDAPAETDTAEFRAKLRDHKRGLIRLLERERKRLEEADRRGLVIRWSREQGWISLHDPTTGEWHEVKETECFASMVQSARTRRRFGGVRI